MTPRACSARSLAALATENLNIPHISHTCSFYGREPCVNQHRTHTPFQRGHQQFLPQPCHPGTLGEGIAAAGPSLRELLLRYPGTRATSTPAPRLHVPWIPESLLLCVCRHFRSQMHSFSTCAHISGRRATAASDRPTPKATVAPLVHGLQSPALWLLCTCPCLRHRNHCIRRLASSQDPRDIVAL